MNTNNNDSFNAYKVLISAFILFCVVVILFLMSNPNVTRRRTSERRKACISNIKILQGAVEQYNDKKQNLMKKLDIDLLVKEKFIRNYPRNPEPQCLYSSEGDLSENGYVYCKYHGEYDEKKEKELIEKESRDKIKNKTKSFFIFIFISSIPSLIYLFFAIIFRNDSVIIFIILSIMSIFILSQIPNISFIAYNLTY